jgi:Spy/CpxP family protein refolding chaperone
MLTNNAKILWWIIALLAVLCVTILATITVNYCNCHMRGTAKSIVMAPGCGMSEQLFKSELGFDDGQMEVFRQSNRTFRREAGGIIADINIRKEAMFEELQAGKPDTAKLTAISGEIGALHTRLKEATVRFYLSLAEVCNAGQKEKLKEIFTPLFIDPAAKRVCAGCKSGSVC